MARFMWALGLVLILAACGSSGDVRHPSPEPPVEPTPPAQPKVPPSQVTERLPLPFRHYPASLYDPNLGGTYTDAAFGEQHYGASRHPTQKPLDARQMPTYHGESYQSPFGLQRPVRRSFVGVHNWDWWYAPEWGDDDGGMPIVAKRGHFDVRYGVLTDGAGRDAVAEYLTESTGGTARRYLNPPEVRIIGGASEHDTSRVVRAVQLINASLPSDAKVQVATPLPSFTLRDNVGSTGAYFLSGEELDNTIHVEFVPADEYRRGSGSAAVTWSFLQPDGTGNAYIQFNQGANSYPRDREAMILLAHELMHALGLDRHVASDFDTIMEGTGAIHRLRQGRNQPLSLLYPVDREALQVLYGRLGNGDAAANFGPWAQTATHLHGNGPHVGFGVAWRNGYGEPYAYGYLPGHDLESSPELSGAVTWEGALLGFTPQAAAVGGDARINVNMRTLNGRADFTGLEAWSGAPGDVGTGATWGDGDLGYTIMVSGNTFRQTGGDDGTLTGIFTGANHEGVGGTLERQDLTAAFGASR